MPTQTLALARSHTRLAPARFGGLRPPVPPPCANARAGGHPRGTMLATLAKMPLALLALFGLYRCGGPIPAKDTIFRPGVRAGCLAPLRCRVRGHPGTDGLRPYPSGSVRLAGGGLSAFSPGLFAHFASGICCGVPSPQRVRYGAADPQAASRSRSGAYRPRRFAARRDRASAFPPGFFARPVCALRAPWRSLSPQSLPLPSSTLRASFGRACSVPARVGSLRGSPGPPLAAPFGASGPACSTPGESAALPPCLFFSPGFFCARVLCPLRRLALWACAWLCGSFLPVASPLRPSRPRRPRWGLRGARS